jgi:hypothetical protein
MAAVSTYKSSEKEAALLAASFFFCIPILERSASPIDTTLVAHLGRNTPFLHKLALSWNGKQETTLP